jgi:hypothetical protein
MAKVTQNTGHSSARCRTDDLTPSSEQKVEDVHR